MIHKAVGLDETATPIRYCARRRIGARAVSALICRADDDAVLARGSRRRRDRMGLATLHAEKLLVGLQLPQTRTAAGALARREPRARLHLCSGACAYN